MIFVTIGTQEPFDRLIKAVDEIAPLLGDLPIIAQVSNSNYKVKNMKPLTFIPPMEFNSYFAQAKLVISHAGMGTILSALVQEKPLIVLPRLVKYGEHRNEHQLSTAKRFDAMKYIHVAYDEEELQSKILSLYEKRDLVPLHKIGSFASTELTNSIKEFINF